MRHRRERFFHFSVFAMAAAAYLASEKVLRDSAVSAIRENAQAVHIDKIVSQLPAAIGQMVKKKVEIAQLRDAVANAKTSPDKIRALTALATFTEDPVEKESLLLEVVDKHPWDEGSATALAFFLAKPPPGRSVTAAEFQGYIAKADPIHRPGLWITGLARLKERNASDTDRQAFLRPLLDATPDFYDYLQLYGELRRLSRFLNKDQDADKAEAKENACLDLPTVRKVSTQREKERLEKEKAEKAAREKAQRERIEKEKAEKEKAAARGGRP